MTGFEERARTMLPWPAADANKFSRGKLVLVAGSKRYPGAACLSARASQRMGAGYTEVITDSDVVNVVRSASSSLVVRAREGWAANEIPASTRAKPCAVLIGSGFDRADAWVAPLLADVLREAHCPVAVDGGALDALTDPQMAWRLRWRADEGLATVITPHGGEAARLARALDLAADLPAAEMAVALARELHAVVVLKGPQTFVSDGGRTEMLDAGTPALAKAGTGDVLAGMVGALLAQGFDAFDASCLAVYLHGRAGACAAERFTEISVCAEDVVEFISAAIKLLICDEGR